MKKILSIVLCLAMLMGLSVAVSAAAPDYTTLTIAEANTIAAAQEHNVYTDEYYCVTGVITSVDNTKYGNMTIEDSTGSIYVYGMYDAFENGNRYDSMENAPGVGYEITVVGKLTQYNGKTEIVNVVLIASRKVEDVQVPENGSTLTIEEALEHAGKTADNRYIITGTITSIEGEEYGNMYIEDETGSIYVYGLYSEDGSLKYNELETKPVVGDTIKVSTKLTVYNNVPQMSSAWLLEIVNDDTTTGGDTNDDKEDNKNDNNKGETTTPTTKPTEAPKPKEYYGTQLSKLSDGDTILIYSVANDSVMTNKEYTYEGTSYTKVELEQLEVSVKNKVVTYGEGAVVLTVHIDGDKVSFTTPSGKYLYADGTDVKFVDKASEYTDFILEETDGGYFIKCATATYTNRDGETFAQYLEVYSGYFTCFSKYEDSDASLYTFQFFEADPKSSAKTGDSISVIAALLVVSAAGIAVIGKKKEF